MPHSITTPDLPAAYRVRAAELERYAPAAAEAFREAAELAERALAAADDELLTPDEVEAEGVCDAETVRRRVRAGQIENARTKGKIQIRRGDLSKLPRGRTKSRAGPGGADATGSALSGDLARRLTGRG